MVSSLSSTSIVWCCRSTRVTVPSACWEPSNLFQTFPRSWCSNNAEFIEAVCWETCRRGVPDHCENLLGSMFADATAGPQEAKQSWGRCCCSFLTFIATRFTAALSIPQAVQLTRWMYLFSVVNLCSLIHGMGTRASLLQITWLSHQSACCHGNTHTSVLLDGVEGHQRDTTW